MDLLNLVDFNKQGGLVPVVVQDHETHDVLMLAYMNREALAETLCTGHACYFSRRHNKLWRKGEESGNRQEVKEMRLDCDADTLLILVNQVGGAACHEGYRSCFFRRFEGDEATIVGKRVFDPATVYKKK